MRALHALFDMDPSSLADRMVRFLHKFLPRLKEMLNDRGEKIVLDVMRLFAHLYILPFYAGILDAEIVEMIKEKVYKIMLVYCKCK